MAFRTIAKQDAKAVADAVRVVGVWTKGANSPKEIVENIKMVVDAIGVSQSVPTPTCSLRDPAPA